MGFLPIRLLLLALCFVSTLCVVCDYIHLLLFIGVIIRWPQQQDDCNDVLLFFLLLVLFKQKEIS